MVFYTHELTILPLLPSPSLAWLPKIVSSHSFSLGPLCSCYILKCFLTSSQSIDTFFKTQAMSYLHKSPLIFTLNCLLISYLHFGMKFTVYDQLIFFSWKSSLLSMLWTNPVSVISFSARVVNYQNKFSRDAFPSTVKKLVWQHTQIKLLKITS